MKQEDYSIFLLKKYHEKLQFQLRQQHLVMIIQILFARLKNEYRDIGKEILMFF
jgi:hypothetical protein